MLPLTTTLTLPLTHHYNFHFILFPSPHHHPHQYHQCCKCKPADFLPVQYVRATLIPIIMPTDRHNRLVWDDESKQSLRVSAEASIPADEKGEQRPLHRWSP